ncbi:hypothetical protein ACIRYZ_00050 [Kitasatospora sp. NPDC101155]|uniref:hypothetical protein n=1 Tax=Kitasatospora sp. NPDC101155 TaxID=3364097 RepID=UPI003821DBCB
MTTSMEPAPEVQQLAQWLTERAAYYLEIPAEQIKSDVKLVEYGLESAARAKIVVDPSLVAG